MRTKTTILFLLLAMSAMAASTTTLCNLPIPEDAEINAYPFATGPLTTAQQASLHLTAEHLQKPVVVYNHYRNLKNRCGGWVLETLLPGTLVLVDTAGMPWYKASCGNRLVVVKRCPVCPTLVGNTATSTSGSTSGSGSTIGQNKKSETPGFWDGFSSAFGNAFKASGAFLGGLLGFLPLLLLAALLAFLACWLWERFHGRRAGEPLPPGKDKPEPSQKNGGPDKLNGSPAPTEKSKRYYSIYPNATPEGHHKLKFGDGFKEIHVDQEDGHTTVTHL